MKNTLCEMTGAEFPLFAFSHCRDVVAAVSRAGGFGVFGASGYTPEELEVELAWIDEHVAGKPYGVDILMPSHQPSGSEITIEELESQIPQEHRDFVVSLLSKHDIHVNNEEVIYREMPSTLPDAGEALLEVAFRHPISLIVSALGIAPPLMIELARQHGVPVGGLVGSKEHAVRHLEAGADIIVAQGSEAGGHCGEISTMVLLPEVLKVVNSIRKVPVLAAGGIMTGRQMAGCMAMGAQGAWTGSIWLATVESETSETFKSKMISAGSGDTVRSRARTGKPARQLRSAWFDAWESSGSPDPLPLPLMPMLSIPAFSKIDSSADGGSEKARELVSYFVGQGLGLVDSISSASSIVQGFKQDFAEAIGDIMETIEE